MSVRFVAFDTSENEVADALEEVNIRNYDLMEKRLDVKGEVFDSDDNQVDFALHKAGISFNWA